MGAVACGAGQATLSLDKDGWENEGGNLVGVAPASGDSAHSVSEVEAFEAQVRSMEATLASDFAGGRIGKRYNTYEHRSRVLRQQQAKLDEMRGGLSAGGQ
jgi:hypothetical protein